VRHWTHDYYTSQIERKPIRFVVSLSSGVPSAVAGDLMLKHFGKGQVEMLFADTLVEDADNYRFLNDLKQRWQVPITRLCEGRTPLQVSEDASIIPNQRIAPCTFKLKIKPIMDYVKALSVDYTVVMVLGMDHKDKLRGRLEAPIRNYKSININVFYPLLVYKVYESQDYCKLVMNLQPPRMYTWGYKHANCGGACVKQGNRDWKRTLTYKPDLFAEYEAWEQGMHEKSEHFKKHGFLRDSRQGEVKGKTLKTLRAEINELTQDTLPLFAINDELEHGCTTGECGVNAEWQELGATNE